MSSGVFEAPSAWDDRRSALRMGGVATVALASLLALTGTVGSIGGHVVGLLAGRDLLFALALFGVGGANLLLLDAAGRAPVFAASIALEVALAFVRVRLGGAIPTGVGVGFGVVAIASRIAMFMRSAGRERSHHARLLTDLATFALFPLYSVPIVMLTAVVRPQVLDAFVARADLGLGFEATRVFGSVVNSTPGAAPALHAVYALVVFACVMVYAAQARSKPAEAFETLLAFVFVAAFGYALYFVFPVAGPGYVMEGWPSGAGAVSLPRDWMLAIPVPRNCMPSLHVAWALVALMRTRDFHRGWRTGAVLFAALTMLATLGLGYHYVLDLVVAVPFAVTANAAATRVHAAAQARKVQLILAGVGAVFSWLLLVRYGASLLESSRILTWGASLATVAFSVALQRAHRALRTAGISSEEPNVAAAVPASMVGAAFVLSGVAGIIYEVVFAKSLALTFGSSSVAQTTVLATYMGGIGLGSWLGARLVAGRRDPLRVYAACEGLIALWCLGSPVVLSGAKAAYVAVARNADPSAPGTVALQVAFGAAVLIVPTVLMGATTPALARFFAAREGELGSRVRLLYAANTFGAGLGSLLTGYAILPALGVRHTMLVAVLANLAAALLALRLHDRDESVAPADHAASRDEAPKPSPTEGASDSARREAFGGLALLGVGGVTSLALEVTYVHLLAVVAGTSAYAFALMLATFLVALSLGASVGSRVGDDGTLGPALRTQALLAASIFAGTFVWDRLPEYFLSFAGYPLADSFAVREIARAGVCVVAMFPSAFLVGAAYPTAMGAVLRGFPASPVRAFGGASALNTLGNIVGALGAHFYLVPRLGSLRSLFALGWLTTLLAALPMVLGVLRPRRDVVAAVLAAVGVFAIAPASFDLTRLASGANVYFEAQGHGRVIDHAESAGGGLTTVAETFDRNGTRVLTLLTNGKFQGDNGLDREVPAQYGLSIAPLLHTARRGSALVVGFGTGASVNALRRAGFEHLHVAELSKDVLSLANRHFADINERITTQQGVTVSIADGRNLLLLDDRQYDLIGLEISSIWFAGAASLYNREFYELASKRLAPGGVLQQWVQFHRLSPLDIARILASVRTQFPQIWVYFVSSQGVIVACREACPLNAASAAQLEATPAIRDVLAAVGGSVKSVAATRLVDPAGVDRFLAAAMASEGLATVAELASSDDNSWLEYSTPKANVRPYGPTLEENLRVLSSFGTRDPEERAPPPSP